MNTAPSPTPTPIAKAAIESVKPIAAAPPTPAPSAETIKTDETISFLLAQNENARNLIEKQNNRIADLEAENALEKENGLSVSKSYDSAQSEIASLKQSNAALTRAVAVNENTIALLQTDRDKQKEKASKATKAKWYAYVVSAGIIALKLLIP